MDLDFARLFAAFRNGETNAKLAAVLACKTKSPIRIMEVCGTHTVAIFRAGIRALLPPGITLLSGPGCPVCVTATKDIDRAIAIANSTGTALVTFGDMLKVPGSQGSLLDARAAGGEVRVIYSPLDAISLAAKHPSLSVVLFGVGFETTAPTVAAAVLEAEKRGIPNFSLLSVHKLVPPAMSALIETKDVTIDGFLCPGHVSAVIGTTPYLPIANSHGIPCVISGFEPSDILQSIGMLLTQISANSAVVENQYSRVVRLNGNPTALAVMSSVLEVCDSDWRGLGRLPQSGLRLRDKYAHRDASLLFDLPVAEAADPPGCRCGDVLCARIVPSQCELFAKVCTPDNPVGPCMVSSEGTCSAWYLYARHDTTPTLAEPN